MVNEQRSTLFIDMDRTTGLVVFRIYSLNRESLKSLSLSLIRELLAAQRLVSILALTSPELAFPKPNASRSSCDEPL